jgi:hypothetical protein
MLLALKSTLTAPGRLRSSPSTDTHSSHVWSFQGLVVTMISRGRAIAPSPSRGAEPAILPIRSAMRTLSRGGSIPAASAALMLPSESGCAGAASFAADRSAKRHVETPPSATLRQPEPNRAAVAPDRRADFACGFPLSRSSQPPSAARHRTTPRKDARLLRMAAG